MPKDYFEVEEVQEHVSEEEKQAKVIKSPYAWIIQGDILYWASPEKIIWARLDVSSLNSRFGVSSLDSRFVDSM